MGTKNTEGRIKFNIADAIIIVVAFLVIVAIGLRIYNVHGDKNDLTGITVEFEISEISSDIIGINKNDKLYYYADNSEIGYITSVTVSDAVRYAYNEDGELVKASVPGKSNVKGTAVLNCALSDKGYLLGGTVLLTESKEIHVYTMTREFTATITAIYE